MMWPDLSSAPPGEDLIAVGADLHAATVISAYRHGLFPMHVKDEVGNEHLGWWSPDPRGVIDDVRVSRSLAKSSRRFRTSWNHAFEKVMRACADPSRDQGWITEEFISTYVALHRAGWAHSVEVWDDRGELVGGLYGISVGGLFAGESMFHRARDASKVALVELSGRVHARPGALLDVQWVTDHLASLGAYEIPRAEYLERLQSALELPELSVPGAHTR